MPRRYISLVNGETYHVLNRFIYGTPYLSNKRELDRFLESVEFYIQSHPPVKYSIYRRKKDVFKLNYEKPLVTLVNYCLMPTHFHFTLRQEVDNGTRKFIQRLSNSFSHYINIKNKLKGSIFEGNFKSIRLEDENQLIHLSRYIHLNPVSSGLVEKPEDYTYSSYKIYLGLSRSKFVDPSLVMNIFPNIKKYKEFVESRVDYQRSLERIKHISLE